ncbi:MAG: Ca2+ regulator and membrane fusion protein Fig1 [Phormidesmis priestleyi Ana]|uniref:Ca2+ regulator and membrane fusion protein Fig1 n=1 Tax=Phormidesmis priestleyi Ana TaxID=1666911 RepID=A0A0P8DCM0_9CYAN|nr:MAG: Ca2+ regulator and membrane fusion protein Fig1 [Phormidesmis priestleyi Ana]
MTLQNLYALIYDYKSAVILVILLLPWISLGICVAIPGDKEEPFVLNFNLLMAVLSLLMAVGYIWYMSKTGNWDTAVLETDILLMAAPLYYVGVSLWITRKRLPLAKLAVYRTVQGLALVGAGYLGLTWIASKIRLLIFSYLPIQVLLLLILGLIGVAYMGYLKLTGKTENNATHRASSGSSSPAAGQNRPVRPDMSIDDELEALRRDLKE